jgi:chromosome partitioning protein
MKTIAIASQKGGTGKTTTAVHLATAATLAGFDAVVIDLDPQAWPRARMS